ncbi:MAG: hypothetical protein ACRCX2_09485 [Paraclostridium sp.]
MKKITITIAGRKDGSTGEISNILNEVFDSILFTMDHDVDRSDIYVNEQERIVSIELTTEPKKRIIEMLRDSLDLKYIEYKIELS